MNILHLDGEVYTGTKISHGNSRYFADLHYQLLMLAWAINNGPVNLWVPAEGQPIPYDLTRWLCDRDTLIKAFNARFEFEILHKLGFPTPIYRFRCTMIRAWSLGFSGGLKDIQKQVGMSMDKQKLVEVRNLINRFCSPAPKNHKADRYTKDTHPDEWELFKAYCIQDVVAERELDLILKKYPADPPIEQEYFCLDHVINQKGMHLDLDLVDAAIQLDKQHKKELFHQLKDLTGLDNPGSQAQFLSWLQR